MENLFLDKNFKKKKKYLSRQKSVYNVIHCSTDYEKKKKQDIPGVDEISLSKHLILHTVGSFQHTWQAIGESN